MVAGSLSACGSAEDRPGEGSRAGPRHRRSWTTIDTADRLEAGGVVAARESASISSRIVATMAVYASRPATRFELVTC